MPMKMQKLESQKYCEPFYAEQIANNRAREVSLANKRSVASFNLFLVAAASMVFIMNWPSWLPAFLQWING